MRRRIPILSTIVVLAAAGLMISLGVWQLHRKTWKEGLIAQYEAASRSQAIVFSNFADEKNAFRRAMFYCDRASGWSSVAGRSASGVPGWAHVARCMAGGPDPNAPSDAPRLPDYVLEPVTVVLGWSRDPQVVYWTGGEIDGLVIPVSKKEGRIIADPPLAGLEANEKPNPGDLSGTTPMGHLSYAIQWFAFALTALVIYALALRKRWRGGG